MDFNGHIAPFMEVVHTFMCNNDIITHGLSSTRDKSILPMRHKFIKDVFETI